jgi:chromosome segregation ATPase
LPADTDLELLRTELLASQSGRMQAVAQLRQSEAERSYLRNELDRAEHTLFEFSRVQTELQSALTSLKAEVASLRSSLETERAIRNFIETSRTWRLTRPIRELLNRNKRQA